MSSIWPYLAAIVPTIVVATMFYFLIKSMLEGDRRERLAQNRFEAELVSIAGIYRTFEAGVPGDLAGKPAQVQLTDSPDKKPGETSNTLTIEPLQTS